MLKQLLYLAYCLMEYISIDDEIVIENVDTLINYLEKIGPLMLKPNIGTDGGRGVILVEMKKKER